MKIRFLGQSGYILKSGNTEIITYPIITICFCPTPKIRFCFQKILRGLVMEFKKEYLFL